MGRSRLVCWWDGGNPASACCIYGRYKLKKKLDEGYTHSVRLLVGKARVTPSSTAKGGSLRELQILTRQITAILPGLAKLPTRISLLGDSECTISAVDCNSKLLDVWFGNRVMEIRNHMED